MRAPANLPAPAPVPAVSAFCQDATDPRYSTFKRRLMGMPYEDVAVFFDAEWGIYCEVSHEERAATWRVEFQQGADITGHAHGWVVKVRSGGTAMGIAASAVALALALIERIPREVKR